MKILTKILLLVTDLYRFSSIAFDYNTNIRRGIAGKKSTYS